MSTYPRWFREQVPLRGEYLAAEWHTRGDGTHVALGRTLPVLMSVWEVVLGTIAWGSDTVKVRPWHLIFVPPPESLAQKADEILFWELAESLQSQVSAAAHGISRHLFDRDPVQSRMPPVFETCPGYLSPFPHSDEQEPVRNPVLGHAFCRRCAHGLVWAGVDPTPEAQKAAWRDLLLRPEMVELVARQSRKPLITRATRDGSFDPNCVIVNNFGPHQSGLTLLPIDQWKPTGSVVAFAVGRAVDAPELEAAAKAASKAAAEAKRGREEAWRSRREREAMEEDARDAAVLAEFLGRLPAGVRVS